MGNDGLAAKVIGPPNEVAIAAVKEIKLPDDD
jgi:hypothetical protein